MAVKRSQKTKRQLKKALARIKPARPIIKKQGLTRSRYFSPKLVYSFTERTEPRSTHGSAAPTRHILKKVAQAKVRVVFKNVRCSARSLCEFNNTFRLRLVLRLSRPRIKGFAPKSSPARTLLWEGELHRIHTIKYRELLVIPRGAEIFADWKLRRYALVAVARPVEATVTSSNPYVRAYRRYRRWADTPIDLPLALFHSTPYFQPTSADALSCPEGMQPDWAVLSFAQRTLLRFEKYQVECVHAFFRNKPQPPRPPGLLEARSLVRRVFAWYASCCSQEWSYFLPSVRNYTVRVSAAERRQGLRLYPSQAFQDFYGQHRLTRRRQAAARRLLRYIRRSRAPLNHRGPSCLASPVSIRRLVWGAIQARACPSVYKRWATRKHLIYETHRIILRNQWNAMYVRGPMRKRRAGCWVANEPRQLALSYAELLVDIAVPYTPYYGEPQPTPAELAAEEADSLGEAFFENELNYNTGYGYYEPGYRVFVKKIVGVRCSILKTWPQAMPVFSLWLLFVLSPESYPDEDEIGDYDEEFDFDEAVHEDQIDAEDYDTAYPDPDHDYHGNDDGEDCPSSPFLNYYGFNYIHDTCEINPYAVFDVLFTRSPVLGAFRARCLESWLGADTHEPPAAYQRAIFGPRVPARGNVTTKGRRLCRLWARANPRRHLPQYHMSLARKCARWRRWRKFLARRRKTLLKGLARRKARWFHRGKHRLQELALRQHSELRKGWLPGRKRARMELGLHQKANLSLGRLKFLSSQCGLLFKQHRILLEQRELFSQVAAARSERKKPKKSGSPKTEGVVPAKAAVVKKARKKKEPTPADIIIEALEMQKPTKKKSPTKKAATVEAPELASAKKTRKKKEPAIAATEGLEVKKPKKTKSPKKESVAAEAVELSVTNITQ